MLSWERGEAKYFEEWCARIEKATTVPNNLMPRRGTSHRAVVLLFGSFDAPITNTTINWDEKQDLQRVGFAGCQSMYIPNTTWTEGRNLLAKEMRLEEERLGRMYDFWVFADDDVELCIHGTEKNDGWQGLASFIDYLTDDIPPNATTVSANSCGQCELRSVTTVDASTYRVHVHSGHIQMMIYCKLTLRSWSFFSAGSISKEVCTLLFTLCNPRTARISMEQSGLPVLYHGPVFQKLCSVSMEYCGQESTESTLYSRFRYQGYL